ncbi:MAG: lipopolysaccharide transport periplasmic protein LptA [Gammaproteobacteria bacterium]|nr:lipopolysaccharide transport periplasmic protein LptA [Gammaproteobacteria bacterium]
MTRLLLTLLLTGFMASSVHAERSQISADSAEFSGQTGVMIFKGTVELRQEANDVLIQADEMTVKREDEKLSSISASGRPVRFQHKGDSGQIHGKANKLSYDARNEVVLLRGGAEFFDGNDSLKGEEIIYKLRTKEARANGDKQNGSRFEMVIQPQPGKQP